MTAGAGIVDRTALARALLLAAVAQASAATLLLTQGLVEDFTFRHADWGTRLSFASVDSGSISLLCLGVVLTAIAAARLTPQAATRLRRLLQPVTVVATITAFTVFVGTGAWSVPFRGAAGVTVVEGIGWVSATLLHAARIAVLAVGIVIAWPYAWGAAAPDGSEAPAGS